MQHAHSESLAPQPSQAHHPGSQPSPSQGRAGHDVSRFWPSLQGRLPLWLQPPRTAGGCFPQVAEGRHKQNSRCSTVTDSRIGDAVTQSLAGAANGQLQLWRVALLLCFAALQHVRPFPGGQSTGAQYIHKHFLPELASPQRFCEVLGGLPVPNSAGATLQQAVHAHGFLAAWWTSGTNVAGTQAAWVHGAPETAAQLLCTSFTALYLSEHV
jgi:hypothetical protein